VQAFFIVCKTIFTQRYAGFVFVTQTRSGGIVKKMRGSMQAILLSNQQQESPRTMATVEGSRNLLSFSRSM
jgi:hypothetical protein